MTDRIYNVGPFSVRAPEDMRPVSFRLGAFVLSFDPDGEHCGRNCSCCEYDDGTAPIDHTCGHHDCGGECGADERAQDRKRVRLRTNCLGPCPHDQRFQ